MFKIEVSTTTSNAMLLLFVGTVGPVGAGSAEKPAEEVKVFGTARYPGA